ncbi:MAG: GTPase HflX [Myxococcales bacterium]|nr:GTPase HflX [Myxococcales bacterium]
MSEAVTGNIAGLKSSQVQALERLYRRRVTPSEIVSAELATTMCELAFELHRQVGVLIDRRGSITHVVVGDASKLVLPDVGRLRGAAGRFRGLRLVHTHLRGEALTRDDLTDLALLRLDLVAAIVVDSGGRPGRLHAGHLLPDGPSDRPWQELAPESVHAPTIDFTALIADLESAYGKVARRGGATARERALVVHVAIGRVTDSEARIAEVHELCRTAGVAVADVLEQRRPAVDPKFLVGRGKLDEILLRAMQLGVELVVFDHDLTPGQARAISETTELRVIDRTMLILDIFAQHAESADGKLQVELAQLRYTLPRLIEKNTMMSRLTGGIGGRGPGETKLEISRRRARDRIHLLEKKLTALSGDRRLRRQRRTGRGLPIVAVCGYTNAGKSTLLNALTDGATRAENKLFATLDPVSRRLRFPDEREVIFTDTVGFIRDLPRDLRAAFTATLEEMADADLLVQVVDASDPDRDQHVAAVDGILVDLALAEKPRLVVWNKVDRLGDADADHLAQHGGGFAVSALDRATFGPLLLAIERELWREGKAEAFARPVDRNA